jgi:hypothetical protein
MATFSGSAGVTDGVGTGTGALEGVCVGEGRCVGVCDGLVVLVCEADADGVGEIDTWGDGEALVSCEGEEWLTSMGMMMSAPTTKNTAAMATLDICIGVLRRVGARLRDLGPYSADYPGAEET